MGRVAIVAVVAFVAFTVGAVVTRDRIVDGLLARFELSQSQEIRERLRSEMLVYGVL